jgi:hypothetical protein
MIECIPSRVTRRMVRRRTIGGSGEDHPVTIVFALYHPVPIRYSPESLSTTGTRRGEASTIRPIWR